jgi:hypothetical protein
MMARYGSHFSTGKIFQLLFHSNVNFFEASITSSLAFFGCLLRGITFRQP